MSEELRPCPFCGKEPSTYEDTGYVYCPNDDCMVADSYWEKAILPVEKWNTRPIEDALHARIAKLRKALIRIEEEYYSNGTWEETADDMYELANDALLNDKESIVNG